MRVSYKRHKYTNLLLLVWLLYLPLGGAWAASFDKGVLWEISRSGRPVGHLFGTIHIEDQRVIDLPASVRRVFDDSKQVALELRLDIQNMGRMMQFMFASKHQLSVRKLVRDQRLYTRIEKAMAIRGITPEMLAQMRPWAVYIGLSMPPTKTGMAMDMMLFQRAEKAGKKVIGLETVEEQVDALSGFSDVDKLTMLRDAVENLDQQPNAMETMIKLYLDRDIAGLMKYSSAQGKSLKDQRLEARLERQLLTDRNYRMVERIKPLLKKGSAFIAVGALHLPGNEGLLKLLSESGYSVKNIY